MYPIEWLSSWIFLIGSVISLGFTANAFFPSKSSRALLWSFAASMLTMELAGHHVLWQAVAALVFVWLGALKHWPGWLALALSVASWFGLFVLLWQGRGARATVSNALQKYVSPGVGPRIPVGDLVFPFPFRRAGVRVVRNVVYARIAGRHLKLDIYLPAKSGDRRPAIMQIHGGAWIVGDKREQGVPLCLHVAANGWVAFNVNYRLSPGATFPEHLIDLKRALVWIRTHAAEYGVDPNFMAATGGSAGGHLAALMALTPGDPRYQPGFEHADTSIQAAVPFYGIYDFTNRSGVFPSVFMRRLLQAHVMKAFVDEEPQKFSDASPIDRVNAEAPPFLVIHGDRDTLAPLSDARAFVEKLRAVSQMPVLYAEIRGAQHAFDVLASPRSAPVVEGVERFLFETHRRYCDAKRPPAEQTPYIQASEVAPVVERAVER